MTKRKTSRSRALAMIFLVAGVALLLWGLMEVAGNELSGLFWVLAGGTTATVAFFSLRAREDSRKRKRRR